MSDKVERLAKRVRHLERVVSDELNRVPEGMKSVNENLVFSVAESLRHKSSRYGRQYPVSVIGDFSHFKGSVASKVLKYLGAKVDEYKPEDSRSTGLVIAWIPRIYGNDIAQYTYYIEKELERRQSKVINSRFIHDDKEVVQDVFKKVFGYALDVNPLNFRGKMVKKSRSNASHDGELINSPVKKIDSSCVYQKVVDNKIDEADLVEDLRVCVIGYQAVMAYKKYRPINQRFSNRNIYADWCMPIDVLSDEEVGLIEDFCRGLSLEVGEIDVLRDRQTKQIYIVDANNTPYGPPNGIEEAGSQAAIRVLSSAFWQHYFRAQ